jgi:hypothetical protein
MSSFGGQKKRRLFGVDNTGSKIVILICWCHSRKKMISSSVMSNFLVG